MQKTGTIMAIDGKPVNADSISDFHSVLEARNIKAVLTI